MSHLRLYDEAERAIQEHRWVESEKAGRDLGVDAERDWIKNYWHFFYRIRLVWHLRGEAFFEEFGTECFAVLSEKFGDLKGFPELVLERVQEGAENLDLIRWGYQEQLPHHQLLQLLQVLIAADINHHRLLPPHK